MNRLRLTTLFSVVLLALLVVLPASAQVVPPCVPCPMDAICPPCRPIGGVFTNPDWLKIDFHRVNVEIENQIARTSVTMQFTNEGNGLAEGTFVFPLPIGASVEQLIMYINGDPIEGRILEADEAREYYDAIVRQYRDPALLEYIGSNAVQANVFPIPPGEFRRIDITYSQILEVDNGLIHYVYPLDVTRLTSRRAVEDASISVHVISSDPISTIYSPSHDIAISRQDDDLGFRVGWEQPNFIADQDFSLYYGIASETINVNLLTYRESATDDGFFLLIVQPPLTLPEEQVLPRDIILVVDQSGSMDGPKWTQAQQAATYVLDQLNPEDRFNVILFSTGWRVFGSGLEPASLADEAADWINSQFPNGGTDINGALTTALDMVQPERPTTILFITDGIPTEGVTRVPDIIANVTAQIQPNVNIFNFGVGNDVDTFLLDSIARDFNGVSTYVRPSERIDEEVASLYNKISAPVLTDVELTIDGITLDSVYPAQPLPDLYAGTQLTVVGRYRRSADNLSIRLSGMIGDERQTFTYSGMNFRERAGGESFIARLWATRRIGDLLNNIRLNGENRELVDSIVNLSIRYGIITPYTSFLIDENDILTQSGRDQAISRVAQEAEALSMQSVGAAAVDAADLMGALQGAGAPMNFAPLPSPTQSALPSGGIGTTGSPGTIPAAPAPQQNPIQTVADKTFLLQNGVWTDTTYDGESETQQVEFLSDEYFALLDAIPELRQYFAVGERVIVVYEGAIYEV
ncbi:VWA domain-containing protein, partial [Anaerolineae bacterium CFX9]|nr:VWA domain-containing protein [Anaerolineae bacterium CFX9]